MIKKKIKTNVIFGILAIVTAVVLWFLIPSQIHISTVVSEYVDGQFIPKVMALLMAVCGIAELLKGLLGKEGGEKEIEIHIEKRNVLFLLFVVLYGIMAQTVSFLAASIVFSAISLYYVGCRSWKKYVGVFLVIFAVCMFFKYGLKVQFGGMIGV